MKRDRFTFAMMMGIPIVQLILFGCAINVNPRHLPADVLMADNGPMGRSILYAFKNTSYFDFKRVLQTEEEGRQALSRGEVQFVVNIPENFSRDLVRGKRPPSSSKRMPPIPLPPASPSAPSTPCSIRPLRMTSRARSPFLKAHLHRSIFKSTRSTTPRSTPSTTSFRVSWA